MKRPILPVLDARGVIVAWKDAPRRIQVKQPVLVMEESQAKDRPTFVPGMLLRVTQGWPGEAPGLLTFEVLGEGER